MMPELQNNTHSEDENTLFYSFHYSVMHVHAWLLPNVCL